MTGPAPLSLSEVHRALTARIGAGSYPVGSRLPTCRALALDLGSNASTVDRAIQRLVDAGVVRTLPRRGTFVVSLPAYGPTGGALASELRDVLGRARRAGLGEPEIRTIVAEALEAVDGTAPRIALVECNEADLDRLRTLVENASGLRVHPVLLADVGGRRLDQEFDAVAAPLFHFQDLVDVVADLDAVVEVGVVVAPAVLRRLAMLEPHQRVAVATPTARGVERIGALVRQYFAGEVVGYRLGADTVERLAGVDVVVRTNAGRLTPAERSAVRDVVRVDWELEPGFAAAFRSQVHRAVAPGRQASVG